jgi:hypothetical protein
MSVSTTGLPNASAIASTPEKSNRSVREYGSTTTSARRKLAGSSASDTNLGTNRTPGGARARTGSSGIRGRPTIHSSAPCTPRQASSSTSSPLYGRSRPKNSATNRFDLSQLIRQRLLGGLAREVLERAEQGAAVRKNGAARLLLAALKPFSKRRRPRPDARPLFRVRRQAEAGTAQGHLFSFGTIPALITLRRGFCFVARAALSARLPLSARSSSDNRPRMPVPFGKEC